MTASRSAAPRPLSASGTLSVGLLAGAVLVLQLGTPSRAHAQLTVDALEVFVTSAPERSVRTVRVRNDGAERVQATVLVEDWERDEHGTNRFLARGSHARSCGTAIEVFPQSLALDAGESATLRIAVAESTPACWGVIFLEHRTGQSNAGQQLSYQVRTGVKLYVESAAAVRDGLIEALTLTEVSAEDSARAATSGGPMAAAVVRGQQAVQLAFRNVGEVQLLVGGHLEVRRDDNSVVHRAALDAVPVLPSAQRLLTVSVPALPRGRYIVLALLDFGGSELVAGQLEYEVR